MEEKYCYIFDYSSCGIFCIDLCNCDENLQKLQDEELINHFGFKASNCHWMFSNEELDIIHINKPLK